MTESMRNVGKKLAALALCLCLCSATVASPLAYAAEDEGTETRLSMQENEPVQTAETATEAVTETIDAAPEMVSDGQQSRQLPVIWQTDFRNTQPTSVRYWQNGLLPADLPGAWDATPATGVFWLEVTQEEGGDGVIHCHSEDAGARYAIMNADLHGFDYSKNYILRAYVKAESVSGTGLYMRGQVGASANKNLGDGYKIKGDTDGWILYELPLQNLAEVAGDNADRMKVEVYFEKFTGDLWVKDLQIVQDYKLTIDHTELKKQVGDEFQLTVQADSDSVDLTQLVWSSSNDAVASVDNGKVTVKGAGVVTIAAEMDADHRVTCTVTVDDPAMQEMYAAMRSRWTDRMTGNDCTDPADADYQAAMALYTEKAQDAWGKMVKKPEGDDDRTTLWDDLDMKVQYPGVGNSNASLTADLNTASTRILDMARAWAAKGSTLYHNEELGRDVVDALTWYHDHVYNENYNLKQIYGNWWHWWIGIPQDIGSAVILMYSELSPELIEAEYATLRHFNEDPTKIVNVWGSYNEQTGANLADTCLVAALRTAIGNDQEGIGLATKYVAGLTDNVTSGDGFYDDGSFIQHGNLGYTAGYGSTLLKGIEKVVYLSNGTSWEMPEESISNVYNWIWNGYRPMFADGAMMDLTAGRSVARPSRTDMSTGRGILEVVVLLAGSAPEDQKLAIQTFAKENLLAGAAYSSTFYSDMAPASMVAAKNIVNDVNIPDKVTEEAEACYAKVFGVMDKFVAHSEDFSLGISYSSERTGRFEVGNKENIQGWHQGDGVVYLYNGDQSQYSDGYWATVDPQRLPGITTDHNTWTLDQDQAWGKYTGNGTFNGGSTLGRYATLAMDFRNYDKEDSQSPNLSAHKAWFVLDDEVVALGAGIFGMVADRDTETIVDNKKINGSNALIVDGEEAALQSGSSESLQDVSWAWMEGNQGSDCVGYYFPEGTDLNVLRESRTGSWQDVNGSSGVSDQEITRNYLSLAIPHGDDAAEGQKTSYSYVLVPGKTAQQMEEYAADSGITILSNTAELQAVLDTKADVAGFAFWQAGESILPADVADWGLTSVKAEQPLSLTMCAREGTVQLAIADPTQTSQSVQVHLAGEGLEIGACADGVTAVQENGGITLTVNTNGNRGSTFTAEIRVPYDGGDTGDQGQNPPKEEESTQQPQTTPRPAETAAPAVEQTKVTEPQAAGAIPQTADTFPWELWATAMILSLTGVAGMMLHRRRTKCRKKQ